MGMDKNGVAALIVAGIMFFVLYLDQCGSRSSGPVTERNRESFSTPVLETGYKYISVRPCVAMNEAKETEIVLTGQLFRVRVKTLAGNGKMYYEVLRAPDQKRLILEADCLESR